MTRNNQSTSLALELVALPQEPNVKHDYTHRTLDGALCQVLSILSRQPLIQQPLFLDVVPPLRSLQDSWGPVKRQREAMLSGLLFLYSLCRKEPQKACELGNDMLRAVECAQDQLERRDSGKRPVLDSKSLLRNLRWNLRRLSSQGEVVPRWQRP